MHIYLGRLISICRDVGVLKYVRKAKWHAIPYETFREPSLLDEQTTFVGCEFSNATSSLRAKDVFRMV